MRSPSLVTLLAKEWHELLASRAYWILLFFIGPLVGQSFISAVDDYRRDLLIHTYSTVGLRTSADFLIWRIASDLEPMQDMATRLNRTQMAKYVEPTQSFLSMTKRCMYIEQDCKEHEEDRGHVVPGARRAPP